METITRSKWAKTHRDYKVSARSSQDGRNYVMRMTEGGTALVPVEIVPDTPVRCGCPDDCNCRQPHRTNYCGCRLH